MQLFPRDIVHLVLMLHTVQEFVIRASEFEAVGRTVSVMSCRLFLSTTFTTWRVVLTHLAATWVANGLPRCCNGTAATGWKSRLFCEQFFLSFDWWVIKMTGSVGSLDSSLFPPVHSWFRSILAGKLPKMRHFECWRPRRSPMKETYHAKTIQIKFWSRTKQSVICLPNCKMHLRVNHVIWNQVYTVQKHCQR